MRILGLFAIFAVLGCPAWPQSGSANGRAVPRLADAKPDFSGIWIGGGPVADLEAGLKPGETIPLLPAAKKLMSGRLAQDDPETNCLPTGIPRQAPYPWTFATAPGRLYILFEGNIHSYRQIFMDGRAHPKDMNPTWYGHSVGRWEGDPLVIDTVGFNDKFWFDFRGHPHTEQLHTRKLGANPGRTSWQRSKSHLVARWQAGSVHERSHRSGVVMVGAG